MKCRRAEELWSDYLEQSLPAPLRKDLEEHLATCAECPRLLAAFHEVVSTLAGLERPAPSPELVERVLAVTSTKPASPWLMKLGRLRPFASTAARPWAALAAAAGVVVVIASTNPPGPLGSLGRPVARFGSQAYSFGLRLYHGSDRLIDELDLLRMTVGVAFEDRLDRLNERLRDLQKAQQKSERKQNPTSDKGSSLRWMRGLASGARAAGSSAAGAARPPEGRTRPDSPEPRAVGVPPPSRIRGTSASPAGSEGGGARDDDEVDDFGTGGGSEGIRPESWPALRESSSGGRLARGDEPGAHYKIRSWS